MVLDISYTPSLPLSLKLGDANLDGFPDILLISGSGKERTPHLIRSVPCAKDVAGCSPGGSGKRGWQLADKDVGSLEAIKDARSISFLDMDEDVGTVSSYCVDQSNLPYREHWTSWCSDLAMTAEEGLHSFRITSITTHSS
jgi:hypothetical protein